jgi:hypothetical protein
MTLPRDYDDWRLSGPEEPDEPPYECKFCGDPSWVDPSDQEYCNIEDHGSKDEFLPSEPDPDEYERGDWLYERMRDRRDGL